MQLVLEQKMLASRQRVPMPQSCALPVPRTVRGKWIVEKTSRRKTDEETASPSDQKKPEEELQLTLCWDLSCLDTFFVQFLDVFVTFHPFLFPFS